MARRPVVSCYVKGRGLRGRGRHVRCGHVRDGHVRDRCPLSAAPACSDWARSQDLSPIGSAGHYQGYLLVEVPLPWPADISEIAELAGVAELALRAGLRLQAIAPGADSRPAGGTADQPRRLIYYGTARPGWAGPLRRRERLAGPERCAPGRGRGRAAGRRRTAQADGPADGQADGQRGRPRTSVVTCSCARTAGVTPAAEDGGPTSYGRWPRLLSVAPAPGLQRSAATGPRPRSACGAPATPGATASPPRPWCCPPPPCGPGPTWPCSTGWSGRTGR